MMPRKLLRILLPALVLYLSGAARVAGAAAGEPPRLAVPLPASGLPVTFVAYGDTRFSKREDIANARARRALVSRIASENPAAILIGGDLVYQGSDPDDYETFHAETQEWSRQGFRVFPALGNHEFRGCDADKTPCLDNWWQAFASLPLSPYRWYTVTIGPSLLVLMLDSDSALKPGSEQHRWLEQQISGAGPRTKFILIVLHYPPVRDPFYPAGRDEKEVARYLAKRAATLHAQVIVIGSHVHNYERYRRNGVTYLVSGGGGASPVPALRLFGELSQLHTAVNFHFIRFRLEENRLSGTMVRFDAADRSGDPWSEPDHFEISAKP